jgi:hypothetical protein
MIMRSGCASAFLLALGFTAILSGQIQRPKVEKRDGHISPLMAKITYESGTVRTVMVLGLVNAGGNSYHTHAVVFKDEAESQVTLFLDTISVIKKPNEEDAIFVLKSGKERKLWYNVECCDASQKARCLVTWNDDGGNEKIDMARLQQVEFLAPARKDKAGNAMFDWWNYSPFTGEKLPDD